MNVNSVDAATYFGVQPAAKKSEMNMEQFLRILVVQLANQNPLEPMNDRDFFAQMAQLGQVQGMEKLQDQGAIQQAQNLMGKTVTAVRPMSESTDGQAAMVTGVVRKLAIKNGEYYLGIQEGNGGIVEVKLANLQSVEPQPDLESAAHLIGKTVSGFTEVDNAGKSTLVEVVGQVIGVSNDDGTLALQIQTANGVVPVRVDSLTNIIATPVTSAAE